MKVVKAETPNDLKGILNFSDDSENYLSCTRMEWVQWLVQQVGLKNDKLGVWVVRDDEQRMRGYMVAINSIFPLAASIMMLYSSICNANSEEVNWLAIETLVNWGRTLGAKEIVLFSTHPDLSSKYGFERVDGIPMVLKIKKENE